METQSSTPGQHMQCCAVEDEQEELMPSSSQESLTTTPPFDSKASQSRFKNDRQHLLQIFPEKVWHLILSKLTHSNLGKVNNSSLFFRQMLLDDRVKSLFQHVWVILRDSWKDKICLRNSFTDYSCQHYSLDPEKNKALKKEELKLRLVCQSWGKSVDKCLEDETLIFYRYDFQRLGEILPEFEATHGPSSTRNPFIGRSVNFIVEDGDHCEFVNVTHSILEKYGHHFWHVIIILDASLTTAYTRLREILQRMRNLKTIYIQYSNKGESASRRRGGRLTVDKLQEFETQAIANPLPVLQELQECTVINLPMELLQHITLYYGHVANISITPEISAGSEMMDWSDSC